MTCRQLLPATTALENLLLAVTCSPACLLLQLKCYVPEELNCENLPAKIDKRCIKTSKLTQSTPGVWRCCRRKILSTMSIKLAWWAREMNFWRYAGDPLTDCAMQRLANNKPKVFHRKKKGEGQVLRYHPR